MKIWFTVITGIGMGMTIMLHLVINHTTPNIISIGMITLLVIGKRKSLSERVIDDMIVCPHQSGFKKAMGIINNFEGDSNSNANHDTS